MADHVNSQGNDKGCGLFDFFTKKDDEESQEDVTMTDADQVNKKDEKPASVEALQRSHSDSDSSSEEEAENGEEKKKKKQGMKEKIKEYFGEKEETTENKDSSFPVEKLDEKANAEATHPDEKKDFLEKIKEKLPGQHKRGAEGIAPACCTHEHCAKEEKNKGILEQLKEKLPGSHANEEKHKEN